MTSSRASAGTQYQTGRFPTFRAPELGKKVGSRREIAGLNAAWRVICPVDWAYHPFLPPFGTLSAVVCSTSRRVSNRCRVLRLGEAAAEVQSAPTR